MITKIEHSENLFLSKLYFSNEDYKKSVLLTKMGVARSVGETTTLCDHTARSSVKTKFPIAEQRFLIDLCFYKDILIFLKSNSFRFLIFSADPHRFFDF